LKKNIVHDKPTRKLHLWLLLSDSAAETRIFSCFASQSLLDQCSVQTDSVIHKGRQAEYAFNLSDDRLTTVQRYCSVIIFSSTMIERRMFSTSPFLTATGLVNRK